jgi:Domain of unknown function DUF11/FG-GAP-like repeat
MRRGRLVLVAVLGAAVLVGSVSAASGPVFAPYQAVPSVPQAAAVATGDVTGDGRADVVVTNGYTGNASDDFRLWVLAQSSSGMLAAPVSYATAGSYGSRIESVAVGDITGDGRADVVVGVSGVGAQVFPQTASGALGSPITYATPDGRQVRLGLLDGDATLDVAATGWGTGTVSVLLNDGAGGLRQPVVYGAPHSGYDDLEVGDVTGDGRDDLVVMSGQLYATPNVSVLAQLAGGGFGAAASYSVGTNILTHGIGIGDVTGDGRNDVVASYGGNRPSSSIAVFAQTTLGTLAAPVSYPSYDIPEPVDVADLDRDGRADVLTVHGGWNAAGVYRGSASGGLSAEELSALPYASHYEPHGLAVGDVNGDLALDAAVADYNHGLVLLYGVVPAPSADLSASVTASSPKVKPRKGFWFDVRTANSGPSASTASLTVQLGGGPTKLSVDSNRCTLVGTTATCTFPDLTPGGSANVRVSGTMPSKGTVTASASVSGSVTDPNGANDQASASIAVG